jgi:hypothetical protein
LKIVEDVEGQKISDGDVEKDVFLFNRDDETCIEGGHWSGY